MEDQNFCQTCYCSKKDGSFCVLCNQHMKNTSTEKHRKTVRHKYSLSLLEEIIEKCLTCRSIYISTEFHEKLMKP